MKHILDLLLRNEHQEREGISITTLADSPLVRHLKIKHKEEIQKIYESDPIRWHYNSFLGRCVHSKLEAAGFDRVLETTLEDEFMGVKIYGTPDSIDVPNETLEDYKTCKVWALLDAPKREWVNQMNIYKWLLGRKNVKISKMKIYAFCLDWSARDAKEGGRYPMKPIIEVLIPTFEEVYKKTPEQILEMLIKRHTADPSTFRCTDKEVWRKDTVYAVMKPGNKRSSGNFDTMKKAQEKAKIEGGEVQVRPGSATRCEQYCVCSQFCPQWSKERGAR